LEQNIVTIEKLVYKGLGLAHLQDKVVFIPYSVPEDEIEIEITKENRSFSLGQISRICTSSPHRIPVVCRSFGRCGGCNWLNIAYAIQLQAKTEIIREFFPFIEPDLIQPTIASPLTKHYRKKVFFPVSSFQGKACIGIYASQSHHIVEHDYCELVPPVVDDISQAFLAYLTASNEVPYQEKNHSGNIRHLGFRINHNGDVIVIIVTKKSKLGFSGQLVRSLTEAFPAVMGIVQNVNPQRGNTILGEKDKILFGSDSFIEKVDGKKFHLRYTSFFQINQEVTAKMFRYISSHLQEKDAVLDAYCGVGAISLSIAEKVKKVIGIEINETAILDAKRNCLLNKTENASFFAGKVEDRFADIVDTEGINTIVFDPPRKGLDSSLFSHLKSSKIQKIIYVSCNPATQSRDIKRLGEIGFHAKEMQPFDMFPQTYHIENIAVLERK
jgi:23S rRNA (uracil1939-C5)-methyltransferase